MNRSTDKPAFSPANPFSALIVENRPLGGPESGRDTRHIAVRLAPDGPSYECGASLGVLPRNDDRDVDTLLARLVLSGAETVALPRVTEPVPLREALSAKLHFLASPTPAFIRAAAEGAASRPERETLEGLASGPSEMLAAFAEQRQIPDLLAEFPSVMLGAQALASALPPLRPRLYSIASSPLVHPDQAHLAVAVVKYGTPEHPRHGVASTFLAERALPGKTVVPVFPAKGAMRLPEDDRDIVMIGPGTGIAPFRAFLQQREATGASGRNWLFYGHRHEAEDYYYRDEIERWKRGGLISELSLAWSRDGTGKRYVQNLLAERSGELWAWLEGGATLYICGNRDHMARDVEMTLGKIAAEKGACEDTEEGRQGWMKDMRRDKRIQSDVY